MQQQQFAIPTPDALRLLGIPHGYWRNAVDKGLFTCSPESIHGRREWSLDDMAIAVWYRALCKTGMKAPMAGGLAALLKEAIAGQPDVDDFSVYAWEDGQIGRMAVGTSSPAEAPHAMVLIVVRLTELRARVRAAVDVYQRKAARRGR